MRNADEFIEIRGARLHVRTAGDGPAVLLVHGWALDLDMWAGQFAALADRYRLIAFDRRGFGLSLGEPAIEQDIADMEELLAVLGAEGAAVVGMSQGARIALRWAMRSRRRASCLVLDGPPREELPTAAERRGEIPMAEYRELVRQEGIDAFRKQWATHPFMRLRTNDVQVQALLREIIDRYPGHDLMANDAPPLSPIGSLRLLGVPVLVVNGEYDSEERRAAGAALARSLPDARLTIVADAGHLPNLDNPRVYNTLLDEFFGSQPGFVASSRDLPYRRSTQHAE